MDFEAGLITKLGVLDRDRIVDNGCVTERHIDVSHASYVLFRVGPRGSFCSERSAHFTSTRQATV